jgi:hypothetical protein
MQNRADYIFSCVYILRRHALFPLTELKVALSAVILGLQVWYWPTEVDLTAVCIQRDQAFYVYWVGVIMIPWFQMKSWQAAYYKSYVFLYIVIIPL